MKGESVKKGEALFKAFTRFFIDKDASLAEINPLIVTDKGDVLALDAKLNFDDNALFRHKDIAALLDPDEEDPNELRAAKSGLSFVSLDGDIACLVNGAGLAMSTMDLIKYHGGEPANFLDVGGGANKDQVLEAFRILLGSPKVKAVLVNIFGGIMKCDIIASALLAAYDEIDFRVPLVVRLEGTNVELGKKILAESGRKINTSDGADGRGEEGQAAAPARRERRRVDMSPGIRGEILVAAALENHADSSAPDCREIRRIEVPDAVVVPGILTLILPTWIVEQLDLIRLGSRKAQTQRGIVELGVFFPVMLRVRGRECLSEVIEWPDATRVLIGSVPLLLLDLVNDSASG